MNDRGIGNMLAYFRRAAGVEGEAAPDAELLGQYIDAKSEAAFTSLINRHGPMVYGVARRVLRDGHAAEDVFQATFLALARKAKSLRNRAALIGWLYRVALRAAIRARSITMPQPLTSDPAVETPWPELRTVLDEEIDKLPDQCRLAVIACYLRGHSTDEAAQQIGCPRGTVLSRLAAARKRLRLSLTKRGYAISIAGLTTGLSSESVPAIPASLLATTAKFALPGAVIAPIVSTLAQGVLHAMWMTKVKVAVISIAAIGLLGVGTGQYLGLGPAPALAHQDKIQPASKPPETVHDDSITEQPQFRGLDKMPIPKAGNEEFGAFGTLLDDLAPIGHKGTDQILAAARLEAALRESILRYQEFQVGRGTMDIMYGAAGRVRDSGLDVATSKAQRIKVLEAYVRFTFDVWKLNKARFEVGSIKEQDYQQGLYYYIDAQQRLTHEREGKPGGR